MKTCVLFYIPPRLLLLELALVALRETDSLTSTRLKKKKNLAQAEREMSDS